MGQATWYYSDDDFALAPSTLQNEEQWCWYTVLVISEVEKLVVPLRDDTEGILEKGDNDEETTNCW